jgi:HAD superfamily hydrolase (TIGR01509 family)
MSKAPPEAVVFDLGKVLVDFDYSIAARKLAAQSRRTPAEVQHLIDHTPLLYQYETGQLTRSGFFAAVVAATGFAGTLEEFSAFFADIFSPIEPMVALHHQLRQHRVPTYIFSNTNDLAVGHIRHNFPFFSQFDGYVLSFEEGAMKPDAKIYQAVERLTGRQGTQLVYLDDRPENVAAGRARGWEVIEHQEPAVSIRLLSELGLPTGKLGT